QLEIPAKYLEKFPFLSGRPRKFVLHCIKSFDNSIERDMIHEQMGYNDFQVVEQINGDRFHVNFGERIVHEEQMEDNAESRVEYGYPRCTCKDWQTSGYPCSHMMHLFAS